MAKVRTYVRLRNGKLLFFSFFYIVIVIDIDQ